MVPLAIDLFCGLGGWTDGLLAEGWNVVGFDIEQHAYGEHRYPAQLVLQNVLTLHGSQFRDAALIVASPPCQEFSYMAMPWSRAKIKAMLLADDHRGRAKLTALFDACFRIQREACEASGRHIPLIVENVRGAQKWVGRSRWNFGSFHLWGDVPALMPMTKKIVKAPDCGQITEVGWTGFGPGSAWRDHHKNTGGSWFVPPAGRKCEAKNNPDGRKLPEGYERDHPRAFGWKKPNTSSHSAKRKAASAMIAKIPFPLAQYIAATFKPMEA